MIHRSLWTINPLLHPSVVVHKGVQLCCVTCEKLLLLLEGKNNLLTVLTLIKSQYRIISTFCIVFG